MRAVVQRVLEASVRVGGEERSRIGPGLLVLLGIGQADGEAELTWMAEKLAHLRVFEDEAGKMNRSVLEGTREVIVVSQFTLYGDVRKGRRPSFMQAREPTSAKVLYERLCERLASLGLTVGRGEFGAEMKVALLNDGPVTLILDTAS